MMENFHLKYISYMYMSACLFATIVLSIYSVHRYLNNEDTTSIKVRTFLSTKDAIYPSMSFCILSPFLEKSFDVYGDNEINMTSYIDFLKGNAWNERFLKVDYDKVTVSLSENLKSAGYFTHSSSYFDWNADYYISFRSSKRKCFTINSPFSDTDLLWYFHVNINNGIFPDGERSANNDIYTYIHYPGQRFTAYHTIKHDFVSRLNRSNEYGMMFEARNIDVIIRRNKIDEPCVEDWRHYDQNFMENLVNDVGCHPPHWEFNSNLPNCSNAKQMQKFSDQPATYEIECATQPCKTIDRLDYQYTEREVDSER